MLENMHRPVGQGGSIMMMKVKKFFQKRPLVTQILLAVGLALLFFGFACLDGINAVDIILPIFGTSVFSFKVGLLIGISNQKK